MKSDAYDADENILKDTCDLVIQFGYITLFISALPIATCFVFINNIFEIKYTLLKFIYIYIYIYKCIYMKYLL
jgi:hypothetical protein